MKQQNRSSGENRLASSFSGGTGSVVAFWIFAARHPGLSGTGAFRYREVLAPSRQSIITAPLRGANGIGGRDPRGNFVLDWSRAKHREKWGEVDKSPKKASPKIRYQRKRNDCYLFPFLVAPRSDSLTRFSSRVTSRGPRRRSSAR